MKDFDIHVDTDAIKRSIDESLRGLDESLAGLSVFSTGSGEDTIDRTFEVGAAAELVLTTVGGEVTIRGRDDRSIVIHAESDHSIGDPVQIGQEDDRVLVRSAHGQEVEYEVQVPRGCHVTVKTVQADVEVEGTRGPVQVETVNGDITIQEAAGECQVVSVSGDVEIRELAGSLALRTNNGDVKIERSRLNSFTLGTNNGDLVIESTLASGGQYAIRTHSGDVRLLLPGGTSADVDLTTVSGDASCRLPVEVVESSRRHWHGRINGGGPAVGITTVSGDLRIDSGSAMLVAPVAAPAPAATPASAVPAASEATAPPPAPATNEGPADPVPSTPPAAEANDASAILQALERGDLTVDEAMDRLDRAAER